MSNEVSRARVDCRNTEGSEGRSVALGEAYGWPHLRGMRDLLLVLVGVWAIAACGDDGGSSVDGVGVDGDVVGGPCADSSECADGSTCIDDNYPNGTCTVACDEDADCPEGSLCISSDGGVCLLPCDSKDDCREGYECEGKSKENGDGESKVCNG
jgi:hypothetical protein